MINNKKGIAMLLVISLILMLLILGGAVLMISTGHFGTSFYQIKRARAFYAAEAGMQHALWKCRIGLPVGYDLSSISPGTPFPDTITITDPSYSQVVNIRVYAMDDLPLGPTVPTPAGTHPIIITVNY